MAIGAVAGAGGQRARAEEGAVAASAGHERGADAGGGARLWVCSACGERGESEAQTGSRYHFLPESPFITDDRLLQRKILTILSDPDPIAPPPSPAIAATSPPEASSPDCFRSVPFVSILLPEHRCPTLYRSRRGPGPPLSPSPARSLALPVPRSPHAATASCAPARTTAPRAPSPLWPPRPTSAVASSGLPCPPTPPVVIVPRRAAGLGRRAHRGCLPAAPLLLRRFALPPLLAARASLVLPRTASPSARAVALPCLAVPPCSSLLQLLDLAPLSLLAGGHPPCRAVHPPSARHHPVAPRRSHVRRRGHLPLRRLPWLWPPPTPACVVRAQRPSGTRPFGRPHRRPLAPCPLRPAGPMTCGAPNPQNDFTGNKIKK
nr:proline-rich protein 36-like [Aegilops tauschii subsp. strangulata]